MLTFKIFLKKSSANFFPNITVLVSQQIGSTLKFIAPDCTDNHKLNLNYFHIFKSTNHINFFRYKLFYPLSYQAYNYHGEILLAQDKCGEAIKCLEEATKCKFNRNTYKYLNILLHTHFLYIYSWMLCKSMYSN